MFDPNYDENFNCIKLTEETKYRLKNIFHSKHDRSINMPNFPSDESDKLWQDPPNIPKSENLYKNIFQRVPQPNEIQLRLAKISVNKPKTSLKKAAKLQKTKVPSEKMFHFGKYKNWVLSFWVKVVLRLLKYVSIYGTELIIQVMAVTAIAIVLLLKFLDKFLSNRHLEICIVYVENIKFSALSFPSFSFDRLHLYKLSVKFLWIFFKLLQFFFIVIKHIFIQLIMGLFFVISWSIYTVIHFFSKTILFPTVDKTISILKMDPEVIANLTKLQISRLLLAISCASSDMTPMLTQMLLAIFNLRFTISQVNRIKLSLVDIYMTLKSFLQTIMDLVKDISNFIRMMLDLHETLVMVVVLLCNTLTMIGFLVYLHFLMLQYIGYVLGIFMQVLISANSALSKLQKI